MPVKLQVFLYTRHTCTRVQQMLSSWHAVHSTMPHVHAIPQVYSWFLGCHKACVVISIVGYASSIRNARLTFTMVYRCTAGFWAAIRRV